MPKVGRLPNAHYLRGLQCPIALRLQRHRPRTLAPEIPESQQHLFDTGHEVRGLAQLYFATDPVSIFTSVPAVTGGGDHAVAESDDHKGPGDRLAAFSQTTGEWHAWSF